MRPRVFPAEDLDLMTKRLARVHCFNEAAGIPRGRPRGPRVPALETRASMRPRVFPAEDGTGGERQHSTSKASMRPRVFPAEDVSTTV